MTTTTTTSITSNFVLILTPNGNDGCIPDKGYDGAAPWEPPSGSNIAIVNLSGAEQALVQIDAGLFVATDRQNFPLENDPSANGKKMITIADEDVWLGKVGGNGRKTYYYKDGLGARALKRGTIDPG